MMTRNQLDMIVEMCEHAKKHNEFMAKAYEGSVVSPPKIDKLIRAQRHEQIVGSGDWVKDFGN